MKRIFDSREFRHYQISSLYESRGAISSGTMYASYCIGGDLQRKERFYVLHMETERRRQCGVLGRLFSEL